MNWEKRICACVKILVGACIVIAIFKIFKFVERDRWVFSGGKLLRVAPPMLGNGSRIRRLRSATSGLKLPSQLDGEPLRAIGKYAFEDIGNVRSIFIPSTVETIDSRAFAAGCYELETIVVDKVNAHYVSVDGVLYDRSMKTLVACPPARKKGKLLIPEGVTKIGDYAFRGCRYTAVKVPESVEEIGKSAFAHSSCIESVPQSVHSIGESAFMGCWSLRTAKIPPAVHHIKRQTFWFCLQLTSVAIPSNSVMIIDEEAFQGCSQLTSVMIPSSVWRMGSSAFKGCSRLETVRFESCGGVFAEGAFADLTSLEKLTLLEKVRIGGRNAEGAFADCTSLAKLTLPEGLSNIGDSAFIRCRSLTEVLIPRSVRSIGRCAFCGCSGLTSLLIPESVESIGTEAFAGCSRLTSLSMPASVTEIRRNAFARCPNLHTVYVKSGDAERVRGLLAESRFEVSKVQTIER